jgi:hypothetical protein
MKIWGINKKYSGLSWWANFMGGHITFLNITIFGANAMSWAVNITTKKYGVICFSLPFLANYRVVSRHDYKKRWDLYLYFSPNGTPSASTFYWGTLNKSESIRAQIRKMNLGHNFNAYLPENEAIYGQINEQFWSFIIDKNS